MRNKILGMTTLYLAWGSTYLAVHYALESFPALSMSGIRFLTAGALLYLLRPGPHPTPREWASAALVGLLLIGLGTGGVAFAAQSLSSGQCALLVALVPVWMTLWETLRPGGRFPGWTVMLGLLLGTLGVGSLASDGSSLWASLMVIAGTLTWAAGSLLSRVLPQPADGMKFSAMSMLWGGLWLSLMGLARGEHWDGQMSASALMAWVYLVVVGSMVGLSVYTWLLRNVPPGLVSTYTYVNPLVAVMLSWLAGESLPEQLPYSLSLVVGGVALISVGPYVQGWVSDWLGIAKACRQV